MAIKAGQLVLGAVDARCVLAAADAGTATAIITTSAAWNGTLAFENSTDGLSFFSCNGFNEAADTLQRTWSTANTTAQFVMGCSGRAVVQVRCTAWVAGTALVTMLAGTGAYAMVLTAPLPAGAQEIGSVKTRPKPGVFTDRSGTITLGGAAQQIAAANTDRRYLLVQNVSTTEDLWMAVGATAVMAQPSILLGPRQPFSMEDGAIETSSVSVIAATTGHPYTMKEIIS